MKKSTKTVWIIGHFGGKENFSDGQTVKTKILDEELRQATAWRIRHVDTYYKKKNPLKLVWDTVRCLLSAQDVFVLLSGNGMRLYFPLLSFCARILHTHVYHDVIGGNLSMYVEKYPKYKTYLRTFSVNYVETRSMQKQLAAQGILNCEVIPNFKRLPIIHETRTGFAEPYRFCTFSRVMREKGIETAIAAVKSINAACGRTVCRLDIFGSVDPDYREAFDATMRTATAAVRYCGVVPYSESGRAIAPYFALLFPTFWPGEGFPGTVVDAFSAGLPVIASDWNSNAEIVEHGKTGLLYPREGMATLEEAIRYAIGHAEAFGAMRAACTAAAERYQPDPYIRRMTDRVNGICPPDDPQ